MNPLNKIKDAIITIEEINSIDSELARKQKRIQTEIQQLEQMINESRNSMNKIIQNIGPLFNLNPNPNQNPNQNTSPNLVVNQTGNE